MSEYSEDGLEQKGKVTMSKYIALGAIIITVLLPFVFLYKRKENLIASTDTVIMGFKEFIDLYNIAPEKYINGA